MHDQACSVHHPEAVAALNPLVFLQCNVCNGATVGAVRKTCRSSAVTLLFVARDHHSSLSLSDSLGRRPHTHIHTSNAAKKQVDVACRSART